MEQTAFISKLCGKGAWGQMVFPSKHCRGALNTVQPRAQTTAVMERQSTSLSSCVRTDDADRERRGAVFSVSHDEELGAHTQTHS